MRFGHERIWNRRERSVLMRRWFAHLGAVSVLVHKFESSDDTSLGLHDHPWSFLTIVLWRGYDELRPESVVRRRPGSIAFRRAEDLHAVRLRGGPSWSICITGPRRREWGFQTAKGWVARRDIDANAFAEPRD